MRDDSSRLLADQFAKGLEHASKIIQNLQTEVHASAVTLAGLKQEVKTMHDNLDSLTRIIRDGNGERSIMARILILENHQKIVEKWMEDNKKDKQNLAVEEHRGKWTLKVALLTGSVSVIIAIANALFNLLSKH